MRILTLNCGSSSLKFDVFEVGGGEPARRLSGSVERIGDERSYLDAGERQDVEAPDHAAALAVALKHLEGAPWRAGFDVVGHRVVHGGAKLTAPAVIDDAVLDEVRRATELAPLHNAPALAVIEAARKRFGRAMPMTASFDTAYFAGLPEEAATYALPHAVTARHGIRRFGFHGLAHAYMADRFSRLRPGLRQARLVTLQLGSGCSATASVGGTPVDTSMGFTPLEGLMMGTRSGDIDAALALYLQSAEGIDADAVEALLNKQSGLLGVSGISADMRDLTGAASRGDDGAKLAIAMFRHRLVKYVGGYIALLGGADAIVFGGGIGEHDAALREHVCRAFAWAGLLINEGANVSADEEASLITAPGSKMEAWVIRVDEASVIAREAAGLIEIAKHKVQG